MDRENTAEEQRDRIVPLSGGHNFRDLGGYLAEDGRQIRWGVLYRSGTMADLTDDDQAVLASLGIRLVCDLRANDERTTRPTRWQEPGPVEFWSRDHEMSVGKLLTALKRPNSTPDAARDFMIAAYTRLPYEQADSYRELFRRVAGGDLPLIFHCSAGKDRTGCAAALLLTAIGIPRATVVEDYLITERFFEAGCRMVLADPIGRSLDNVSPEIWQPMMRAETAYIEAMFQALEARHGSVEAFLGSELGVDDAMRVKLRDNLLI